MELLLIIIVCLLIYFYVRNEMKSIKEPNVYLVTGGVKTGKSAVSLWLAKRRYNRILFRWKVKRFVCKLFRKEVEEKPLFYSNIPLSFDYVPLTREILLRQERLRYKSVTFIDEASLVADSMSFQNNDEMNEALKYFEKLYGHETCGGYLYHNTQNLKDVHYNIKRSLCSYLWIHSLIKWIPFIIVARVREMYYSDESDTNIFTEDIEESTKTLIMSKKVFKQYDCYCYSVLTDSLPVADNVKKGTKDLKQPDILYIGKEFNNTKSKKRGVKIYEI